MRTYALCFTCGTAVPDENTSVINSDIMDTSPQLKMDRL